MKQVLFLCSGNYYRSRYAEHLFNWLSEQAGLDWRADSRGLRVGYWGNIGPISNFTVEALKTLGITLPEGPRDPQQLALADLTGSELVVAVKESEHRAMMADLFPLWADRVEYWHVDDLDCAQPHQALPCLEKLIRELVDRLRSEQEKQKHQAA
jgi:protein-tyrosine phosphatase